MHFWAECFNPNVLCQLVNPDRALGTGRSVVRGKPRLLMRSLRGAPKTDLINGVTLWDLTGHSGVCACWSLRLGECSALGAVDE